MKKQKKIMVFGVFDLLHPGHLDFFKQAKALGDYLVVSVARDTNAKKAKGYLPVFNEKERLMEISALSVVDEAMLGGTDDPWQHIKDTSPDIIALGYDQNTYVSENDMGKLEQEVQKHGINARVMRLRAYKPEKYKTTKIRQKIVDAGTR